MNTLVTLLSFCHYVTTLLFGIYLSAAFLGVRMTRRNVGFLALFSGMVGVIYLLSYLGLGGTVTEEICPLIVHAPLVLFLSLCYNTRLVPAILSVLTAYLCCQISKWLGLLSLNITHQFAVYYGVRIAVTVLVFFLLLRFAAEASTLLLQKSTRSLLILGLMPAVYYLFDYATGVYTSLLYSGLEVVVEFLGFVLCLSYLFFLLFYFRQYEEKQEAEQQRQLMQMQQAQAHKELEAIRRSEHAVSVLRHDMRHFLSNLSVFIENGETERALAYIGEIAEATDQTANRKYCRNELINQIVASHAAVMERESIAFSCSLRIPEQLSFSDVDLTSILSNALENAVHAVLPLPPAQRHIVLDLHQKEGKLLLSLKNTFAKAPCLQDGLPLSNKPGHGLGSQSIRYVTEKLGGQSHFAVQDGWFVLQVIL